MSSYNEKLQKHVRHYAKMGWRIFPCRPKEKVPATAHGCKDATAAPEQIAAWWNGTTLYNVGLATGGGIVVLDVDIDHNAGKYGDETLAALEEQYSSLPETWTCLTGGGGTHYYFQCDDPALTVGTGFAPGLDYRGAGGYVIIPPSTHENGREYEWEASHTPTNSIIAPLPEWLHTLMLKGRETRPMARREATQNTQRVTEGGRNDILFRTACSLRGKGLSEAAITAALLEENRDRCDPPLADSEVEKISRSAGKYPRGSIENGHALNWDGSREGRTPDPAETDKFFSYFKTLDEFEEEEARWIVPGWIPEGQITLLSADGGIGKTTLWCNILSALSTGTACILDPPGTVREPARVAFLTREDSVRKKLKKKLRLAGANMKNIVTPDFVAANRDGALQKFDLGSKEMDRFLRHFKFVLCAFDPVQGFIPPKVNMGSRNEMRHCTAPLVAVGEELNTTFLIVSHTNKRKGAYGRDRIADSADLWDIARSVIMGGFTEEQGVRYLSNEKNNYDTLQETILFTIDKDGHPHREGTTWKRDREFIQAAELSRTAPKREDCKNFLMTTLIAAGGVMPVTELEDAAKAAGYSFNGIKTAKKELKTDGSIKYFTTGSAKAGDLVWHIQALKGLAGEDDPEAAAADEPPRFEELEGDQEEMPMEFKEDIDK